jgi:SET and MYND domain-containing protein 4
VTNDDKKCEISIKLYTQLVGHDVHRKQLLENDCREIKERIASLGIEKKSLKISTPQQCISSNLKLQESLDEGKFFVADDQIDVGETLLVERAKCACLYPKNFGTHCTNCFVRLVAPIGCKDCASVAFCSTECRDVALSTYHKFECKFLDLLIGSGMSILCHLTLRLVIQHQTPEKALEEGSKLSSILCKNSSRRSHDDFFKRCLMSTFLLRCLQKAEFFGRRTTESAEPTAIEYEVGTLIFGYLQAIQFNAHEIYETVTSGHKFIKSKVNYIGVGIYEKGNKISFHHFQLLSTIFIHSILS